MSPDVTKCNKPGGDIQNEIKDKDYTRTVRSEEREEVYDVHTEDEIDRRDGLYKRRRTDDLLRESSKFQRF